MSRSVYKIKNENSNVLIVSFAGHDRIYGGIQRFEFVNFLNQFNVNKYFYNDYYLDSYHHGIFKITRNIDETVNYLKNEIKKYTNVIFLGASAGGYAAILFGSLCNVTTVFAFIPQTLRRKKNVDEKYRDISGYINDTTQYYLYGDLSVSYELDVHHISHCERIAHHPNVTVIKKEKFDLREMRDNGELFTILNDALQLTR